MQDTPGRNSKGSTAKGPVTGHKPGLTERSVLLVSEISTGFHGKLAKKTEKAFKKAKFTVNFASELEKDHFSGWYDRVHVIRLTDPVKLLRFFTTTKKIKAKVSFTVLGLAEILRDGEKKAALSVLSKLSFVDHIFIFTIHPGSLKKHCQSIDYLQTDNVVFLREPPYEETSFYRGVNKYRAREELAIHYSTNMALYFGSYWFSKGPDLLLKVAKEVKHVDFYFVGDTKLGSITITPSDLKKFKNIHFIDKYVSDFDAALWFQAADVIVLPYRKFYEHDTSGIVNQAMQAQRPMILPNFSPFINVFDDCSGKIGRIFEPEDTKWLRLIIETEFDDPTPQTKIYDHYLAQIEGWDEIGRLCD